MEKTAFDVGFYQVLIKGLIQLLQDRHTLHLQNPCSGYNMFSITEVDQRGDGGNYVIFILFYLKWGKSVTKYWTKLKLLYDVESGHH